jgi:hypothetical protein
MIPVAREVVDLNLRIREGGPEFGFQHGEGHGHEVAPLGESFCAMKVNNRHMEKVDP